MKHTGTKWRMSPERPFVAVSETGEFIAVTYTDNPADLALIVAAPELGAMLLNVWRNTLPNDPTRIEAERLLRKAGLL